MYCGRRVLKFSRRTELDPSSTHSGINYQLTFTSRYSEGWRYYEARFSCPDLHVLLQRQELLQCIRSPVGQEALLFGGAGDRSV